MFYFGKFGVVVREAHEMKTCLHFFTNKRKSQFAGDSPRFEHKRHVILLNMFNLFAHAGHSHAVDLPESMSIIDHCLPVVIGAGIIIAILAATIVYFLVRWQPKKAIDQSGKNIQKR